MKDTEGDPKIKARIRAAGMKILQQKMMSAVPSADVVVTNPTHYAVALKWDSKVSESPVVNAKGVDEVAQTIKRLARENDIPLVENRPVARGLYTEVEVGDIIPEEYLKVIALIYSHLEKFQDWKK